MGQRWDGRFDGRLVVHSGPQDHVVHERCGHGLLVESVSEEVNCKAESRNESESENEREGVEATRKERRTRY